MSKKTINKKKGKRYTKTERQNILAYVNDYNTEHGRGGLTGAVKKYGISAVTIRQWLTASEVSQTQAGDNIRALARLKDEIQQLQQQLDAKQVQYEELKSRVL